jgi:hypothetical protein
LFDRGDFFAFFDVPFDSAQSSDISLSVLSVHTGACSRTCSLIGKRPRRKRVHLRRYPI